MAQAGGLAVRARVFRDRVGRAAVERIAVMIREHPTSQIQHPTSNLMRGARPRFIGCWVLDVGCWMFFLWVFISFVPLLSAQTNDPRSLILVVGAAGDAEYGEQFAAAADLWRLA